MTGKPNDLMRYWKPSLLSSDRLVDSGFPGYTFQATPEHPILPQQSTFIGYKVAEHYFECVSRGYISFPFGKLFEKGLTVGTGQCNVKVCFVIGVGE